MQLRQHFIRQQTLFQVGLYTSAVTLLTSLC